MITYKDLITGKTRFTRGKFIRWTKSTGLTKVRYAIIRRPGSSLLTPEYLFTCNTRATFAKATQSSPAAD